MALTLTPEDLAAITDSILSADPSTYGHDTVGGMLFHTRYIGYKIFIDADDYAGPIFDGSQLHPFNVIADAIDLAESERIHSLVTVSELQIDRNLKNFTILGVGTPKIVCNGHDLKNSEFFHCLMTGSYLSTIIVQQSRLVGPFYLNGFFENCAVNGAFTIPDGATTFMTNCAPLVVGSILDVPTYDIGGIAGTANFVCMDYKGGIRLLNVNNILDDVKIQLNGGIVIIDSSCTLGSIRLLGTGILINESSLEPTINNLLDPLDVQDIHAANFNKRDNIANTITIYEDDEVTPRHVFDTNADLSVITPQ